MNMHQREKLLPVHQLKLLGRQCSKQNQICCAVLCCALKSLGMFKVTAYLAQTIFKAITYQWQILTVQHQHCISLIKCLCFSLRMILEYLNAYKLNFLPKQQSTKQNRNCQIYRKKQKRQNQNKQTENPLMPYPLSSPVPKHIDYLCKVFLSYFLFRNTQK